MSSQFVDEATIEVSAGNGGHGCLSFCREKYRPKGGPDGGDGGQGGSVYLIADPQKNTLNSFRYQHSFQAQSGEGGQGNCASGKSGSDLFIPVPLGTVVFDYDNQEKIAELLIEGQSVCVALGGKGGLGNVHFKSSVNRAPRKTKKGGLGEKFKFKLTLKLLADVGILGAPNAGKSTFIRAVSNATPKVAPYPFTTLVPQLGVVSLSNWQRFVIADVPGLLPGASQGVGLGNHFLNHLMRTKLILHIVDVTLEPLDDVIENIRLLQAELKTVNLDHKICWLVLNKIDTLSSDMSFNIKQHIQKSLNWTHPLYLISGLLRLGTEKLCQDIWNHLIQFNQE